MRPAARMPKLTRRSRILIAVALAVVLLLLFGPRMIDAYVDWMWFGELGYRSVFTTKLVTRVVVFLVAAVVMGAIVFAALLSAGRSGWTDDAREGRHRSGLWVRSPAEPGSGTTA